MSTTEVKIGGDRLGSGNKEKVQMRNYERSNHDIGYLWRSTMASGVLVPFLVEPMLPGDTFDIELNTETLTYPAVGPLFGSYKLQLDIFQVPVRLYQAQLHNNKLGIGMKMQTIKLPQIGVFANKIDWDSPIPADTQQINPSSLLAYLGIRGVGQAKNINTQGYVYREFNAVPYLAYWDIYKNYYANKQEERGAFINTPQAEVSYIDGNSITHNSGTTGLNVMNGDEIMIWGKSLWSNNIMLSYVTGGSSVSKPILEVAKLTSDNDGLDVMWFQFDNLTSQVTIDTAEVYQPNISILLHIFFSLSDKSLKFLTIIKTVS